MCEGPRGLSSRAVGLPSNFFEDKAEEVVVGVRVGELRPRGEHWQVLQVNPGLDLSFELIEYDLPAQLFEHLGEDLGASVAPEVQVALPPAWLGLPASAVTSPVLEAAGRYWMLAAAGPGANPAEASIYVLGWEGRRWAVQGRVGHRQQFTSLLLFPQYNLRQVPSSQRPEFHVGDGGEFPTWSALIGYVDGAWRVVKLSGR